MKAYENEKTYKNTTIGIAIIIEPESKSQLLQFDMRDGEVLYRTEGILKSISKDMKKEIEEFFSIKLVEFDVAIEDEKYQLSLEEDK